MDDAEHHDGERSYGPETTGPELFPVRLLGRTLGSASDMEQDGEDVFFYGFTTDGASGSWLELPGSPDVFNFTLHVNVVTGSMTLREDRNTFPARHYNDMAALICALPHDDSVRT